MSASKFTAETRGALLERTAAGVSLPDACRALGLREQTVKSWLQRGRRESDGPFAEFVAAIEDARLASAARPGPMDAAELACVVSQAARAGSVAAMKLRHAMLVAEEREDAGRDDADGPLAEVDELARRRVAA